MSAKLHYFMIFTIKNEPIIVKDFLNFCILIFDKALKQANSYKEGKK
jgi:hypothetical protein